MGYRQVRAQVSVPRVRAADGRLVVPPPVSPAEPWAPYDLVVDVLRKDVDLDVGEGPWHWYDTSDDRERPGPFVHPLPVPIDLDWLHRQAVLDVAAELRREGNAFALVLDGCRVETQHDPDSPRWRDAGWAAGAAWTPSPARPGLLSRLLGGR